MRKEVENFSESSVMEGLTSIRAIIASMESCPSERGRIQCVLFDTSKEKKRAKEIHWLSRMGEIYGFEVIGATEKQIEEQCTGNSHGGIIALTLPKKLPSLIESEDKIKTNGFYVMMDGIEDPYNFGYAIRSLYAFGIDGIVLTPRNWMSASGVVARASAGASELVDMFVATEEDAVEFFHAHGFHILCAQEDAPSSLQTTTIPYPIFAIVGGEKRGVSAILRQNADIKVRIDYGRDFHASLSAASAATVLAYEIAKQHQNGESK